MFNFFRASLLTALALLLQIQGAAAEPSDLKALLIAYRCPVVDRLDRIFAYGERTNDYNRFLAITVPEHRHGYVQCIFQSSGTKLLCEASSGFYSSKPGEPRAVRLEPAAIDALAILGFSTSAPNGNFQVVLDVTSPPDLNRFADFMLKALHVGYGARAETNLQFNAPFAPGPPSKCIPVS